MFQYFHLKRKLALLPFRIKEKKNSLLFKIQTYYDLKYWFLIWYSKFMSKYYLYNLN